MVNGKKELKIYHGAAAFVLFLICLIIIRSPAGNIFGRYGSAVGELLFLLCAVGTVLVFRCDLREAFPVKKPKILPLVGGGIMLWAMNSLSTAILMIAMYLAPKQVEDAAQQLGGIDLGGGLLLSVLMIAVLPAICEEAVFRGVLQSSLKRIPNKWVVIVIIGVLFGACHGSWLKLLSTGLIGGVFAYIVYETGNMTYTVLLHFFNNFVSVILLYLASLLMRFASSSGAYSSAVNTVSVTGIPLFTVAIYVLGASFVPFAVYIGNYLLHKGLAQASGKFYTKEKKAEIIALVIITGAIALCGFMLLFTAVLTDTGYMQSMMN